MLFSERKRLREIEAREAEGESLWTGEVPEPARRKIAWAFQIALDDAGYSTDRFFEFLDVIFQRNGFGKTYVRVPEYLPRIESADRFLDHVEAIRRALSLTQLDTSLYDQLVNEAFNEHRVAFRLVDDEVVPLSSDELHVEVVEPTLRLLTDSRFAAAHASYVKALKEISVNDPGDAITDAATALQQTLVALDCRGNALGPLLKDAKKRGLLGSHDQTLIEGVAKFVDWVSADRSTMGDAHDHSNAVLADAWLVVHVVGALIVRLADETPRGSALE